VVWPQFPVQSVVQVEAAEVILGSVVRASSVRSHRMIDTYLVFVYHVLDMIPFTLFGNSSCNMDSGAVISKSVQQNTRIHLARTPLGTLVGMVPLDV
jgi:hypothetical protein